MATADLGLVIGSKWYAGNKITGTSTTPEVFDTDIEYALTQDLYLNTTTANVYQCALEGDDTTAKWQYVCNIKGLQPPVVNSLNSTSTTDALSANMGNVLFEKLLNSGVFTQDIIVDVSDTIYSVVLEVENKDSTITFTSEDDTATYSVTKSGTSETQTLNLTIESLFTESGVVIKEISSTENIYSVTLNGSGGTEVFSITPSLWDKLNELDQQVKPGGSITDGEETLKEGVISKLINGVKTALYPITHAKATWFNKAKNLTVHDVIRDKHVRRNITDDLDDLFDAISEQNLTKYGYGVGDYFVGASGYTYILDSLNLYKSSESHYAVTSTDHISIVVDTGQISAWLSSGSITGYSTSTLHTYLKGTVLTNIKSDFTALFGSWSDHLIATDKLYNTLSSFAWSSSDTKTEYITALTEAQVYGCPVFSANDYQQGEGYTQLQLFRRYTFTEIFGYDWFWLRSIYSASYACYAGADGRANYFGATVKGAAVGLILVH